MNYGSLISEAFWLTWRNRFLWFFGFFAGGGASFNFNFNFNSPTGPANPGGGAEGTPPAWLLDPGQWIADNLGLILAIAALAILVILVFIAFSILSQGALVDSVVALHGGETRRFSSTWRAGLSHFWRVLGLGVLFLLLGLGLFLVIAAPTALAVLAILAATNSVPLRILFIVLVALAAIALFVLLAISLTIVGELALRELVVRGERVVGSIGSGYRLFRQNLGRSLLVWIIQVALSIGVGIVTLIVFLILGIILIGPAVALFIADQTAVGIVIGVVGGLLFLIPFLVVSGAIGTFYHAYWTLAYLRLTSEGAVPRPDQGT